MATMHFEIVTGERLLYEGDVDMVVAPGSEGEMTVLPHHAALMTMLLPGELRYGAEGQDNFLVITGGFMQVTGETVTVLADAAEHVEEVDEARAEEAVQRAQERLAQRGEDIDLERALYSLRRAQVRLEITRRRRRRGAGAPERESGSH
jgi:F-type H+-transporting ATPase subunit epsilon